MEEWLHSGGCDGFNIMFPYVPGGLDDFVDRVVPELQRRGLFRREYEGRTLRENLGLPRPRTDSSRRATERAAAARDRRETDRDYRRVCRMRDCAARSFAAHSRDDCNQGSMMRASFALALVVLALVVLGLAGCATPIPSKDDFGASALLAVGNIPPGFADFNRFDPATNDLIAQQLCATPFQRLEENAMEAAPGRLEHLIARCRTHVPLFGS